MVFILVLCCMQYFVDMIREQQLVEWGLASPNGGPHDDSKFNSIVTVKCQVGLAVQCKMQNLNDLRLFLNKSIQIAFYIWTTK